MSGNKKMFEDQKNDEHKVFASVEEQILHRPGQWIGSIQPGMKKLHVIDGGTFQELDVEMNQGLAKIIEEVIINAADEHVRTASEPKKRGWVLNKIDINVSTDGKISVHDNGGIDTGFHSTGPRIAEVIFGSLFSSSNYDDENDKDRKTVGTHGVGGSLANLFSKKFQVTTADGEKQIQIIWEDNKTKKSEPKLKALKQHYTKIDFEIELKRFRCMEIPEGVIQYLERLCVVLAAAKPGLEITFNGKPYKFKEFSEFVKLFNNNTVIHEKSEHWEIIITPTLGLSEPIVFGIVNGAECHEGTHIQMGKRIINTIIMDRMKKEKVPSLSHQQVYSGYNMFINIQVAQPAYNGQNKDELVTELFARYDKKKEDFRVQTKFEKYILDSTVYTYLKELANQKNAVLNSKELKKAVSELNKKRPSSLEKLVDATETNKIKRQQEAELWVFEGGSASSGFRANRIPKTQGCYSLKGKILNTSLMKPMEMMKNKEISEMTLALGLDPLNPDDLSNLRYKWIGFCTDMDWDGFSISALGITWLAIHYPKMITEGKVYRIITPLYKVEKGKDVKYFYSSEEFEKFIKGKSGYDISYFKGIGSLTPDDLRVVLQEHTIMEKVLIDDIGYERIETFMQKDDDTKKGRLKEILKAN